MKQQLSSLSFADLLVDQRKVKQTFFSQIDKIINWNPIRSIIEIAYTKGNNTTGRPIYDSLVLFKTELLRTWYGLSDGEVEEQVNDRLSFSRFVVLGLEDVAPDSTMVCRFRNILVEAGLYDMVLNEINHQLEQQGFIVRRGAIVDASITDSPRSPRGRKESEVVEDRDEETGKDSAENKETLARMKLKSRIMHKGTRGHKITEKEKRINVAISKIRYRVERTFGSIHR